MQGATKFWLSRKRSPFDPGSIEYIHLLAKPSTRNNRYFDGYNSFSSRPDHLWDVTTSIILGSIKMKNGSFLRLVKVAEVGYSKINIHGHVKGLFSAESYMFITFKRMTRHQSTGQKSFLGLVKF